MGSKLETHLKIVDDILNGTSTVMRRGSELPNDPHLKGKYEMCVRSATLCVMGETSINGGNVSHNCNLAVNLLGQNNRNGNATLTSHQ